MLILADSQRRDKMQRAQCLLVSVLVFFTLSACTTMQPVEENASTEAIVKEIKPGDEILLVTKSGDKRYITVSSISEGYIFSVEESYNIEDIEITEVRRLDVGETAGQSIAVVGGIGFALLFQFLITALVVVVFL
jgi:hypothetical protein